MIDRSSAAVERVLKYQSEMLQIAFPKCKRVWLRISSEGLNSGVGGASLHSLRTYRTNAIDKLLVSCLRSDVITMRMPVCWMIQCARFFRISNVHIPSIVS